MSKIIKLKKELINVSTEVENLNPNEIMVWIEENIVEIRNDGTMTYTLGGPNIYINLDTQSIEGYWGSVFTSVSCDTTILEEYYDMFQGAM